MNWKIWTWFQKSYDQIKLWDVSPNTKAKMLDLSKKLPDFVAKGLVTMITAMYAKYGKDYVGDMIAQIKAYLDELGD